jgi:hypothetical protein
MNQSPKIDRRAARTERLRVALRDNLKRRKAQARGRAGDGDASSPDEPAGEPIDKADDRDGAG